MKQSGSLKVSLKIMRRGRFVYEGYNCHRFLRYLNKEPLTYEQVRGRNIPIGGRDRRTHNVDLITKETDIPYIRVENNRSQFCILRFNNKEEFKVYALALLIDRIPAKDLLDLFKNADMSYKTEKVG